MSTVDDGAVTETPFYCGRLLWKGVFYPWGHTVRLCRRLFDRVQLMLKSRSRTIVRRPGQVPADRDSQMQQVRVLR